MAATEGTGRWYAVLKISLFVLLASNAAFYLYTGTFSEGLDTVAWLVLLVLFELETGSGNRRWVRNMAGAIHGVRITAAAAIGAAAFGYARDEAWLDVVNIMVWIAVIALLEFEIRRPLIVAAGRVWFAATAATLYAGLGILVMIWAWRGDWFDAYDALLWLTAFATIEMDVLGASRNGVAAW